MMRAVDIGRPRPATIVADRALLVREQQFRARHQAARLAADARFLN